jgi:NADP-dependent 3-hydroxy acid dehydrogenase YdfG
LSAVLVTGAAGDIGAALAEELARQGRDVVLADHPSRADELDSAATAVTTFDVTDAAETHAAIAELARSAVS